MDLGELLQELREGILNDKTDRYEGTSDYLWTDETLVRYINEAHRRFASKSFCLQDGSTDECTLVTLVEGQEYYPLHESVLAVRSIRLAGERVDLTRVGHPFLAAYRAPSENWVPETHFTDLPAGRPLAFATDEELGEDDYGSKSTVQLRVYPKPDTETDGLTLRMRVVRKPLDKFVPGNLSMVPEIPEDHHLEMLDWAAYLALRIVDDDAGNLKRASDFMTTFDQNVAKARNMVLRKMMQPMAWGFGRHGWSWEH